MDHKGLNICGVQCRNDPLGDYWNTVTVKVRDIKNTEKPDETLHYYALVAQQYTQKWAGHPWTPRIGDTVLVLFSHNSKPIIICTIYTGDPGKQDPVCRAPFNDKNPYTKDARYDDVNKWCQHVPPLFDLDTQEVITHFPGQHPICSKKFHKYRDQIYVTDCKEGHQRPCNTCTTLDWIKRPAAQWEKIYSDSENACVSDPEHPYIPPTVERAKRRHEWHEPSGSYFVFQNNTDHADYGKGLIRLENATAENAMGGHLNFRPTGTIDLHAKHCATTVPLEAAGARFMVVASTDTDFTEACEIIDFDTGAYFKIYKNGDVEVSSPTKITAKAPYIKLDGNTEVTGSLKVDGNLIHGACSCTGTQDFTTYTKTDPGNKLTVNTNACSCSAMPANESDYCCSDCGPDYLDDCRILFNTDVTTCNTGSGCGCCGMTNNNSDDLLKSLLKKLVIECHGSTPTLSLSWYDGTSRVAHTDYTITLGVPYFCELKRATGSTTATLDVYSDVNRQTKLTTLTLTHADMDTKFRYLYSLSSMNNNTSPTISASVSNLVIASH
jgi:phage baseplate assembly protein gpV